MKATRFSLYHDFTPSTTYFIHQYEVIGDALWYVKDSCKKHVTIGLPIKVGEKAYFYYRGTNSPTEYFLVGAE